MLKVGDEILLGSKSIEGIFKKHSCSVEKVNTKYVDVNKFFTWIFRVSWKLAWER